MADFRRPPDGFNRPSWPGRDWRPSRGPSPAAAGTRRRKGGSMPRTRPAAVYVRLTATERAALHGAAVHRGLSAAALVRAVLVDAGLLADSARRPSRSRPPEPPPWLADAARVAEAAAEATGALVRTAAFLRRDGATDLRDEIAHLIPTWRALSGAALRAIRTARS